MLTFATLGPAGSNHALVTGRYLEAHVIKNAQVRLVDEFGQALVLMTVGDVDFIVQAAVHPAAAETVAKARFKHGFHVVDTFIAPSHPLAILTRRDVTKPRTLGLQPATQHYADTSRWPEIVHLPTTVAVGEALLNREIDSGLTQLALADAHPAALCVDVEIGTIDDPWLVIGRSRTCDGNEILTWQNSPGGRIELLNGDLTEIPPAHRVDVLVVSAFQNDYAPLSGTLIGALHSKGLNVDLLARTPETDLRESFNTWVSPSPSPGSH